MAKNTLNTSWTSDGLLIAKQSVGGDLDGSLQWVASRLDGKRILLSEVSSPIDPSTALGFAKCTSEMLYDLILGIHRRGWTGMVNVDLGVGYKRLFFTAGELVFAGSDLMDDRLGEVIYRHEMITLDQLTDFAVQVDRKTKFGQVLLRSGKFTNTDLWNALKSQVAEIFRSIFFVDHCVIEVREGTAPIEVSFESGTEALLDAAYSFGAQFRGFCRRVRGGARVFPVRLDDGASIATGTFAGDLLQICSELQNIQDILNRSKLADLNTLFAIHKLISCGRLRVEGLSDPVVSHLDGRFTALKSCIDSYQFLHGIVIKSFESAGLALPIRELSDFALSLNQRDDVSIYLDSSGVLSEESIGNILRQCSANLQRLAYFRIRIESLTRYLLQMAGDLLPNEISADLKRSFREISQ
jgi:hypothetical protein